jgi:type I restriction enzyme S subunit
MSDLPEGWLTASLAEITSKIGSGATPTGGKTSYNTSGIPLIRSMNVHFSGFHPQGLAYIDEKQAKKLENVTVHSGDVLLNITGASIGRVTIAPPDMNGARVNQHVAITRLVDGLENGFLCGFLGSPSMQRTIAEENYGVTRQALTKTMIEDFRLPVPPLQEQRRIVAKIGSLSAKSKRARRDHLDHIPRLVEKYKQAILAAAFRGELTREWRTLDKPENAVHSISSPAERRRRRRTTTDGFTNRIGVDFPELPTGWSYKSNWIAS